MPQKWIVGPIDNLKILIANSATFRTVVGAADVTEALTFIDEWETARNPGDGPFAVVGSAGGRSRIKRADVTWINEGGDLFFIIYRPTDEADLADPSAAGQTFANLLEEIVDEMEALAGTDEFLNVERWTEAQPPTEGDDDLDPEGTRFWFAEIGAEYR